MRRGQLQQKIQEVNEQNNLPEDVVINKGTIQRMFQRSRTQVFVSLIPSPLQNIETQMIATILQLARIWKPCTPSQGIMLANAMIKDTPVQKDLI